MDASNTNGLLSPTTKPDPSLDIIKEEPMEVQAPQAPDPQIIFRKSPTDQYMRHPPLPPPPTNGHVALNLSLPTPAAPADKVTMLDRRASFSSSGQDDPSTDSEAVRIIPFSMQPTFYVGTYSAYFRKLDWLNCQWNDINAINAPRKS